MGEPIALSRKPCFCNSDLNSATCKSVKSRTLVLRMERSSMCRTPQDFSTSICCCGSGLISSAKALRINIVLSQTTMTASPFACILLIDYSELTSSKGGTSWPSVRIRIPRDPGPKRTKSFKLFTPKCARTLPRPTCRSTQKLTKASLLGRSWQRWRRFTENISAREPKEWPSLAMEVKHHEVHLSGKLARKIRDIQQQASIEGRGDSLSSLSCDCR